MWGYLFGKKDQKQDVELQTFAEGHRRVYPEVVESNPEDDFVIISNDELLDAIPDAESRKLVNELVQELANLDLTKIKTEQDLVNHIVELGLKRGKHIDAEGIRKYFKANNIEIGKLLKDAQNGKWTKTELAFKIGITIAGVVAVHWFAGPYAAIAARALYTKAWGAMWGIPSAWNPIYWTMYLPGKEHFGYLAYKWAPWAVNGLGGWFYHKAVDGVKAVGNGAYNLVNWARSGKNATSPAQPNPAVDIIKAERDALAATKIETDFAKLNQKFSELRISDEPVLFKLDAPKSKEAPLFEEDVDFDFDKFLGIETKKSDVAKVKESIERAPALLLSNSLQAMPESKLALTAPVITEEHPLTKRTISIVV